VVPRYVGAFPFSLSRAEDSASGGAGGLRAVCSLGRAEKVLLIIGSCRREERRARVVARGRRRREFIAAVVEGELKKR
jgi:hypothetical protein